MSMKESIENKIGYTLEGFFDMIKGILEEHKGLEIEMPHYLSVLEHDEIEYIISWSKENNISIF